MTLQQIFDKVTKHLLTQNKISEDYFGCVYRGDNGLKCAVGCLIPDHLYHDSIENKTVDSPEVSAIMKQIIPGYNSRKEELLMRLQEIHDEFETFVWKTKLQELALTFNLKFKFNK